MMLVPVLFGSGMLSPPISTLPLGIPDALGMSGSGSGPSEPTPQSMGWTSLEPTQGEIAVSTDGFFVFNGHVAGLSTADALAGLNVSVRTVDGIEVEGQVKLLEDDGVGNLMMSWSTTRVLAVETTLRVSIHATPSPTVVAAELTLSVVSSTPAPPDPLALSFTRWSDLYFPTGPLSPCMPNESWKAAGVPQAAASYELRSRAVLVQWQPEAVAATVRWELRLEGEMAAQPAVFTGGNASLEPMGIGLIVFEPDRERVCATVTLTDRDTGKMTKTEKCQAPEPSTTISVDGSLAYCEAPPSEATVDLWCKLTTPEGMDCNPPAPDPPASRRSKSCQLGPAGGNEGAGPLGLLLLTLARRRQSLRAP